MTSAKSSDKAFGFTVIRTMRKNWHFPALVSLAVLFATVILGIFNEWMIFVDRRQFYDGLSFSEWFTERAERVYFLGEAVMGTEGFIALLMIFAMATGIMIFRYMFSKKAVNVYYSLGISRSNMFFSKYLSGVILLALAVFVPLLIDVIINLAVFGSTKELWITVLFYFLGVFLSLIFAYSVAVAVCCRVGTIIEAIVYSLVFLLTPVLITTVINFFFRYLLYGSPIHECEWIFGWDNSKYYGSGLWSNSAIVNSSVFDYDTVPFAEVFYFDAELQKTVDWFMPDFASLIPLAFLTAAVTVVALVTYKKRKTEIAGFLGSDEAVKAISVFVLSSSAACIAIEIFNELTFMNISIGICLAVIIFFAVYISFEIVSLHNARKIFKALWKYLIHLSVAALLVVVFANGLFGYSSRVPDAEDVESVSVSTGTGDVMMNYNELSAMKYNAGAFDLADYYLLAGISYQGMVDGITDADDIENIINIHEKFIECKNLEVNDETLNAGFGKRVIPVKIRIDYSLRNGKTIERLYPVATDEIMQMLAELTKTERYKELAIDYIQKPVPKLEYNKTFDEYYYSSEPVFGLQTVTVEAAYSASSERPFTFRGADVMIASPLFSNVTYIPGLTEDTEIKDNLLNVICEDIGNGTLPLNYRTDSRILGYIVFENLVKDDEEYDEYSVRQQGGTIISSEMSGPTKINVLGGELKACIFNRVSVPVYEDMINTLNFLKENNLDGYLSEASEISKIRVWVPDEQSVVNANTYDGASMLWCGWWFNTDETCLLIPGNAKSVTDKNDIEEISSYCTMMCLACYENYYAEIIFEDGSRTFAAIPIK